MGDLRLSPTPRRRRSPRRSPRRSARRLAATSALALALTSACVPPAADLSLPTGTGLQWVQDTGGTTDENGTYHEAYARFTLLDGVTNGPTPVETPYLPLTPTAGGAYASYGFPVFPDGTARFPWNGFAGEGVTTATTVTGGTTTYVVTGAGGSCTFANLSTTGPMPRTSAAIPSPDGGKLAVFTRFADPDANSIRTTITIYALDASCTRLNGVTTTWNSFAGSVSGAMIVSSLTVWSPDSASILYPVNLATARDGTRLERLAASGGSTPTTVLEDPSSTILPLGWSSAGRALIFRISRSTGTPPVAATSLETLPIGGGHTKVIDVHTSLVPPTRSEFHVGYFLPGTSQVVYSGGPRTATAGDGRTVAWPQLRIHDDTTDTDVVVPGTDAPLAWHPTPSGDMPNGRFLERFIHGTGATT